MVDFASLGESADDFAGVLSFSPIVLSQYLLKPFLNLLLTILPHVFSDDLFRCCLQYNSG